MDPPKKLVKLDAPLLNIQGLVLEMDILTEQEEETLLAAVDSETWDSSLSRRTQHYGFRYDYNSKSAAQAAPPIPEWCHFLIARLLERHLIEIEPDQLIVNEYRPGQGIYPHVDSVGSFCDGIVSVSLGSDISMDFIRQKNPQETASLMLPRRSALVLHGPARYDWRHGIASRKKDGLFVRRRRVSLTFRKMK